MRITTCGKVLLASLLLAESTALWAQPQSAFLTAAKSIDVGITYAAERAQIAPGICGCFWLQGGGADAALAVGRNFAISASLTGDHVSNYYPGIDINKIAYLGGPRYTQGFGSRGAGSARRLRWLVFGEALFGGVHAFGGAFPSNAGLTTSANSFALQAGGGINLFFHKKIGVRLLQADYVRTQLPNNYSKSQNDLRLAVGLTYRFGSALGLH